MLVLFVTLNLMFQIPNQKLKCINLQWDKGLTEREKLYFKGIIYLENKNYQELLEVGFLKMFLLFTKASQ